MATALEVIEPLRSGLVPVPAAQPGICGICHSSCTAGYDQCIPCSRAVQRVGAEEVIPIALSLDGGLLHRHLRGYKDGRSGEVRVRLSHRLAALLTVYLARHRRCLAPWDLVEVVPSVRRNAMIKVVGRTRSLRDEWEPTLEAMDGFPARSLTIDRFEVIRSIAGERILLIDDTFTTGASLFSAAAALREKGAHVQTLVLGRHVDEAWDPSREMMGWLGSRSWDEARCVRCGGEYREPGSLPWGR